MSKKDKEYVRHINRRIFLKGLAATGAIATISAGHPTSAEQPD